MAKRETQDGTMYLVLFDDPKEWRVATWFDMLPLADEADPDPSVHLCVDEEWFFEPGWFFDTLSPYSDWSHVPVERKVLDWQEMPEIPS